MLQAIVFDMGGTLDGDGLHWLDRFYALYDRAGLSARFSREEQKRAFYHADALANRDQQMPGLGFRPMIERYVDWQLGHLGVTDSEARNTLLTGFADPAVDLLKRHKALLETLAAANLKLGIISNFCGNISTICDEFGYSPLLSVVLDSRHVGVSKPDPAIFRMAADQLGVPAAHIAYVGDSFERDVEPARRVGWKTFWIRGSNSKRVCPDPTVPDAILQSLLDLPDAWRGVA